MRNPAQSSSSSSSAVAAAADGRGSGGGKGTPCCSKVDLKRGPWTAEEDELLASFVQREGEGRWRTLPKRAGLLRCGKSCRLRWMNYLRPSIKRGPIDADEEDIILRLHCLLGNRWSLIAGRIPGRTDNEIKNYWNTHLSKKLISQGIDPRTHKPLAPSMDRTIVVGVRNITDQRSTGHPPPAPQTENANPNSLLRNYSVEEDPRGGANNIMNSHRMLSAGVSATGSCYVGDRGDNMISTSGEDQWLEKDFYGSTNDQDDIEDDQVEADTSCFLDYLINDEGYVQHQRKMIAGDGDDHLENKNSSDQIIDA